MLVCCGLWANSGTFLTVRCDHERNASRIDLEEAIKPGLAAVHCRLLLAQNEVLRLGLRAGASHEQRRQKNTEN